MKLKINKYSHLVKEKERKMLCLMLIYNTPMVNNNKQRLSLVDARFFSEIKRNLHFINQKLSFNRLVGKKKNKYSYSTG